MESELKRKEAREVDQTDLRRGIQETMMVATYMDGNCCAYYISEAIGIELRKEEPRRKAKGGARGLFVSS